MIGAVFHGPGDVRLETLPDPEPGPGEALVRVARCGVCGSDAGEFADGPILSVAPVVLGHEFVGTIEALGPGTEGPPPGATVVCGAGVSCGRCRMCRRGRTNLCRRYSTAGFQRDGGLAGHVVVPVSTLLDVSATGLPLDTLALAQPMSIAVHAVRRSGVGPDDTVAVLGVGGIGTFLTVALAATGAHVLVTDIDPERLELARELGAAEVVDAREQSLAERFAGEEESADVFFEVSGTPAGLRAVLEAARPGATIVPVGIQHGRSEIPLGEWTVREYAIVGTNAHVFAEDLPEAVGLLAGDVDWARLAPTVLPLADLVEEGLRPMVERRATRIKTLIDPWATASRAADHARAG